MRFADYGNRVVFAAFDGGEITSDAGVLLLREQARRIRLFERMAGCFTDHRDRERLTHTLPALLAQRVCGMALGYEDIIDHDTLRFDPALKLLASPRTGDPGSPAPLAGESTLNRLEQSWETGNRRYHQMVPNLKKLSNLFVTLFLDAHQTPPARITLDIDATDVETHGRQENAFFHGYYEHRCFLPLYVFCGRHLLLAQLRPANIDGAKGARNQIRRIVADDPRTLAQRRHPAARRQRLRAREPDALVRRKCRGLRLRPGAQRCPAQESTEGPRQGRHSHDRNRPAGPRLRRFPPHHQITEPEPGPGASSPRSNTSPDTNSAAASSSPPWIATKSRPGNSTKTPIAHAATWKTASRTANSICSPIA